MGWGKRIDADTARQRRNVRQRTSTIAKVTNAAQKLSCDACGTTDRQLHKHHPDYGNARTWRWLCVPCHAEEHRPHKGVRDLDGLRRLINQMRG